MLHKSVLLNETIFAINPQSGGIYVDMTLGAGGHTRKLLEKSAPDGIVIAFDKDEKAISYANETLKREFKDRLILVHDNYSNCLARVRELGFDEADGVVMDLGVSLDQLKGQDRGFSFLTDGPLDMRMDKRKPLTAEKIVNGWEENELANILRIYGEERFAGRIARNIVRKRPIRSTRELAGIVESCIPRHLYKKTHPATRVFQALRIVVNDELESLQKGLTDAVGLLKPKGTICVISFHSLEDRVVKNIFREFKQKKELRLINKKPILPSKGEVMSNRRARSAKLRCAVKDDMLNLREGGDG